MAMFCFSFVFTGLVFVYYYGLRLVSHLFLVLLIIVYFLGFPEKCVLEVCSSSSVFNV